MEPNWLRRFRRIEVFDESAEKMDGPQWAWLLALGAATLAYLSLAAAIHSLVVGRSAVPWGLAYIAAFSIMSGAAWHLGLRARAANQIIICLLGLAAVWVWQTP